MYEFINWKYYKISFQEKRFLYQRKPFFVKYPSACLDNIIGNSTTNFQQSTYRVLLIFIGNDNCIAYFNSSMILHTIFSYHVFLTLVTRVYDFDTLSMPEKSQRWNRRMRQVNFMYRNEIARYILAGCKYLTSFNHAGKWYIQVHIVPKIPTIEEHFKSIFVWNVSDKNWFEIFLDFSNLTYSCFRRQ